MALQFCRISFIFMLFSICPFCYVQPKVLLISMDGFRWDYINKANTPNFDEFGRLGTKAPYINNTFVTKSFPCHYTIATGLYEETHGIVAYMMYDPVLNQSFSIWSKESAWWDGGEPLWVTVQRHALKSAVYYWPGSESIIRGKRPNIYRPYNVTVPFQDRINTVIDWLTNSTKNIDLVMLYFHEPDATGHRYGPNSDEVVKKVEEMDGVLGDIVKGLENNNLWDEVNVIVTSDHGMTEVDQNTRGIDLSQYIDLDDIDQMPTDGAVANILPKPGKEDELYNKLDKVSHMKVYRKDEIPDFWHYKNNNRILPLLLVADEGWMIGKNLSARIDHSRGAHGFDNRLKSMKPIFFARGPNVKMGFTADPFNSVDIYPLVCELLGIRGAKTNGTLANTRAFIVTPSTSSAASPVAFIFPSVLIAVLKIMLL